MDWLKEIERLEKEENPAAVILRQLWNENNRIKRFNKEVSELNRKLSEENQMLINQRNARR